MSERTRGWVGVDLDATLAIYDGWKGPEHIGPPVPTMLARVKLWLRHGHPEHGDVDVKIVTARVSVPDQRPIVMAALEPWMLEHIGVILPVTHEKDYGMIELWDDRVVQVEPNTGRRMDGHL
jgi:hypothetical protein